MTPTRREWSRAFARQAQADFDAWASLHLYRSRDKKVSPLPRCQELHFLQMACEKLAKSHLLEAGSKIRDLEQSHAYISKHLPAIVRDQMILNGESERAARSARDQYKRIAREIELLAPSVQRGGKRKDNCEYPWEEGGRVIVPAEWPFSTLNLLTESGVKTFSSAFTRLSTACRRSRRSNRLLAVTGTTFVFFAKAVLGPPIGSREHNNGTN